MKPTARQAAIVAALVIAFLLLETALFIYADIPLALYAHGLDASYPGLVDFFRAMTDLGKSAWYLWPCGLAALVCGFASRGKDVPQPWRRLCAYVGVRAFFLFSTIALSGIIADIIKPILGRARPLLFLSSHVYGFVPMTFDPVWNSMPSGHATTAFALAAGLSALYPRLRVMWFAYALILAASRVAVDAHFLSDVCAGAALGWLTVRLFLRHGMLQLWKVIFPIDKANRIG